MLTENKNRFAGQNLWISVKITPPIFTIARLMSYYRRAPIQQMDSDETIFEKKSNEDQLQTHKALEQSTHSSTFLPLGGLMTEHWMASI